MVQNLRSWLSQATAYPDLGVYTRISGQSKPRLIFSRINGPNIDIKVKQVSYLFGKTVANFSL